MVELTQVLPRTLKGLCWIPVAFILCATIAPSTAEAQRYASDERSSAAVGHYARARSMMVEALKEFEQGRRLARPDLVLDSEDFRLKLISLTEDLNRVVDPKPRVTRDGVVFRANPRLVRRDRDSLPPVAGGPQDSNIYGEIQRQRELEQARARMYDAQSSTAVQTAPQQPSIVTPDSTGALTQPAQPQEGLPTQLTDEDYEYEEGEEIDGQSPEQPALTESDYYEDSEAAAQAAAENQALTQDQEIANAIEQAIQERIRNLDPNAQSNDVDDDLDGFDDEYLE